MIMLGKYELNKIYNEDCYKAIKNIPDKSIDLMVIDPPYKLDNLDGGKGMLEKKKIDKIMNDLKDPKLCITITEDKLDDYVRVMKKINIYVWCNKKMIPFLFNYFVNKKKCLFDIIIWNKTNAMPLCSNKYLTDCEYCLYFHEQMKLNTSYETAKTVYCLPINIEDKNKFMHPTIKPLEIIKNLIINSSKEGDIVLDTFMGSGTTAVACKNTNRNYIGFEINKKYYDIACKRLNNENANGQMKLFTD